MTQESISQRLRTAIIDLEQANGRVSRTDAAEAWERTNKLLQKVWLLEGAPGAVSAKPLIQP